MTIWTIFCIIFMVFVIKFFYDYYKYKSKVKKELRNFDINPAYRSEYDSILSPYVLHNQGEIDNLNNNLLEEPLVIRRTSTN